MLDYPRPRTRDGFALPVALLAIMVIGALVTGGFYASSQDGRIRAGTDLADQAFHVAEYGLESALGTWRNADLTAFSVGETRTYPAEPVSSGGEPVGSYTLRARSIGPTMFLVSSEGTVTAGSQTASRVVGSIVRTLTPALPAPTALAIHGGLSIGEGSEIRGDDSGGPGCTVGDAVAGVTAFDSTRVDERSRDRIAGSPPVLEDAALDTAALSDFGAITVTDLMAHATRVYDAGASESGTAPVTTTDVSGHEVCDVSVKSNWGAPNDAASACYGAFPIIHAKGDLELGSGTGQGILIVEGNLLASGPFTFYGVVIVMGGLRITGTGNLFEGSVVVRGSGQLEPGPGTLDGSRIQYSACRTRRAFDGALRPRPLAARAWMDFTAMEPGGI
ncbi:MAG: hypothetical protein ACN0LA_03430 [Candidatus Longimicrobiales bacterium M2_2A_002]